LNTSASIVTGQAADTTIDLASPTQLVDHEYTITVLDRHENTPLEGAAVNYVCGTEYQLGLTDTKGMWAGKLPYCAAGGFVVAELGGYVRTGVSQPNTEDDRARSSVELRLWPLKEKTVFLYKRSPTDIAAGGSSRTVLGSNESSFLTIARHKETPQDDEVPLAGVMQFGTATVPDPNTQRTQLDEALAQGVLTQEVYNQALLLLGDTPPVLPGPPVSMVALELAPGTYDIDGFLQYNGLIQIPADRECKGNVVSRVCVDLPAQNFTTWLSGGVTLTGTDAVTFSENAIYSNTSITVYVLEQPLPATWDDLKKYQGIADYQTYDRRAMVQPDVS
jgi:hypothetical protein